MAAFQEVMRQWVRAKKAINENNLSCWPLEMFTDDHIANIEKEVMSWAAEHPEPKYQSWGEWLSEIGVFQCEDGEWRFAKANEPIPADIAEKLGIEPKEG